MRLLWGILGAVVGIVTGGALTLAIVLGSSDSTWATGFSLIFIGPVGLLVGLIAGVILALRAFDFLRRSDPDGVIGAEKRRVRAALVLGPLLIIGLSLLGYYRAGIPPDDAVMVAHFAAHRGQFEELARMAQHDKKLADVARDFTNPSDPQDIGVSPARIALYQQKLQAAGGRGFERTGDGNGIDFLFWADVSGSKKDIAYLSTPPPSVLPTLDGSGSPTAHRQILYRSLGGPWYLRYEVFHPEPMGSPADD